MLLTFHIQDVQTDKAFVHADGILPVVGRRRIDAGIVDTYGIILEHLFHESVLTHVTDVVTHEVGGLHTLLHLVADHVAPVASWESHDKGEIAFLIA